MNRLFCFALFALIATSFAARFPIKKEDFDVPAINKELIDTVNSDPASTWVAGANEFTVGKSLGEIKKLLGWNYESKKLTTKNIPVAPSIPATFDAATQWPKCDTIGTIYNQADCGSCWAFGCVEAVSDRFCISSNGKINEILSFMDEVACNQNCDGCEGGDADSAWDYISESGIVTNTCYPYDIPTCPPEQQPCLNFVDTPNCQNTCNDTENWNSVLVYLSEAYDVNDDVSQIQTEIMTNGPVEACFTVYSDFVHYKSGVYQYTNGTELGGHCVKIIGWGVEGGLPYWLINNSWTTYWGDNGQFKILRGQDECGIEDDIVAGTPNVSHL